ncbi:T9SS type A sorting domain-containing protein [Tamlana fucoidanivorans]|uniref:T9SS type A sorting domain-containing protein n=1 Tax=Allotamlana fucoidanivorans TaxID=2583814 RepID=A0A5C4SRQ8_9FLAO|nr:T9SS type A sorting domain-containing protein [Tamlana fucoidanivorans]TNJ47114.1 T9SS type A sorting domain-containing protein [Tamlana fucoidanivorans]
MSKLIVCCFIVFGMLTGKSQNPDVTIQFNLPVSLNESSGVIYLNDKLVTHNDSGNSNALYELDVNTATVTRTIEITNADNVDWEDITHDSDHIYIGDIGNNVSGNRTDLKIYKVSKSDFTASNSVQAEIIAFSYLDQTDFTGTTANNTEWDAEALVSFDSDNLMLFSKNWINDETKAYVIPKTPGDYELTALPTTLASGGLITGGTYNPFSGKLYLIGYSETLQPFIWVSEGFTSSDVFSGTNTKTLLSSLGFEQTEAITYVDENSYYVTSEFFYSIITENAKLIALETNDMALSKTKEQAVTEVELFPNPVNNMLHINSSQLVSITLYDARMLNVFSGTSTTVDMSQLPSGLYFAAMKLKNESTVVKKIVKK